MVRKTVNRSVSIGGAPTGMGFDDTSCSSGETSPSVTKHGLSDFMYHSLAEKINQHIESKDHFFSLEFFPPRTKIGAINLLGRLERMSHGNPLFCDVTWHSAGNPAGDVETGSMTIAAASLNYCGLDTMLHMACCNSTKDDIDRYLRKARGLGIRNILALRGDPLAGKDWEPPENGFSYAVDLVRYIRQNFGDYFVIGVAGYPHGHPDSKSYEEDLHYLKEKVEAGADFVITQLFFKAKVFLKFVEDCRRIGIRVPIIPGIMPIQNYDSLRHVVKLSKLDIPSEVLEVVQSLKDNDEAIRNYGITHATEMIKELMAAENVPGVHIYTLNQEYATVQILRNVGLWCDELRRPLPWRVAANARRCSEDVRPIFWASRPKSYIYRTQNWDEFPNGRWGSSESPAFGDLKDYYLFFMQSKSSIDELRRMWGEELIREADVWDVFYYYVSGECNKNGIKVTRIPWNDDQLSSETDDLRDNLMSVNKRGVLTINSQPRVNGAASTDPVVGWGHAGGYIYQKAYLEFFTCVENVVALLDILPKFPSVNYHVINKKGDEDHTNCHKHRPIAVTWGVFPGCEIIQPTVVDPVSFKVWKDEAFALWVEQWGRLYPEDSDSFRLISRLSDEYYLVNLVDNEYVRDSCLFDVIEAMLEQRIAMNNL